MLLLFVTKKLKPELLADTHNATEIDTGDDAVGSVSTSGEDELLVLLARASTLFSDRDD